MREEMIRLLEIRRLPGRITAEQAAPLLGFAPHDIPVLVKAKLLKPLGNPPQQAVKYFASCEIVKSAQDEGWLNRATRAIYTYWASHNLKRRTERQVSVNQLAAAA